MNHMCTELHQVVNGKTRYHFPYNHKENPKNGIYFLFEKGEEGHAGDRIVRIGTHTGVNQLRSRLRQHFVREQKDRSIFRKNIGRCVLNHSDDPYLEIWDFDCTSSEGKAKYGHLLLPQYQFRIEASVTQYIQDYFSFCVLELAEKNDRLYFESRLISTVSNCSECKPSRNWFGHNSPSVKIRESGLWQVNELYKESLTTEELNRLTRLIQ